MNYIYCRRLKPASTSEANQETPWQKLDRAFRSVLTVSKADLLKAEAKEKRLKKRKQAKSKRAPEAT